MDSSFARTGLIILALLAQLAEFNVCAREVALVRTPNGGIQPQAMIDAAGTTHLIYYKGAAEGGDIFYVRMAPGQTGFSTPIQVNTHPASAIAIGTIRGAQMALGRNGRVHVAWNGHSGKNHNFLEAPMLYTRMNDSGTAFELERNVITTARGLDGGGSVAADSNGNVYVMWHAPKTGQTGEETERAVFVARSSDDGQTFAPEKIASLGATGACGCCGMKAYADSSGDLFAVYRADWNLTNRDETLLISHNHGADFQIAYSHGWKIGTCPMSSAFISESAQDVLAAAETHGRVYYVRVDPKTGKVSDPVCPDAHGKHPVAISNGKGQTLLAWTENTAWARGGSVSWQIFDPEGKPISPPGHGDGLPAWSLPAAVARLDGSFAIFY